MITKRDIENLGFTTVKQIGYSQSFIAELPTDDRDILVFLSYKTIIAFYNTRSDTWHIDKSFYSVTTSRHRNKLIASTDANILKHDDFSSIFNNYKNGEIV